MGKPAVSLPPSVLAWIVTVGAVLLGVVALTNEQTADFGPRVTVFLVLAALGVPTLAMRAWRSAVSWPARAAIAFVAVAAVSAALSTAPLIGFFGANQVGTGWLFLMGLAALWALGTDLETTGAALLGRGLVLLALLNAAATVLEVGGQGWSLLGSFVSHFPGMQFGIGQPAGFAINPVYSAQLIVGGMALLAWRAAPRNPWSWWVMVGGLGAGTYLSGERYGLLFVAGLVVWVFVARRGRAAVAFTVAAGGGLLAGLAIQSLVRLGTSTQFRLYSSEGASGAVGPRLRIWIASLHAVAAHPLFGSGPGQSESATTPYRTAAAIVRDGVFPDTHNILVEIAVTTGVLGVALFVAWLVPAFRHARGALLLYAVALFAGGLLEPLNLTATGLAFLALGAAAVGAFERAGPTSPGSSIGATEWGPAALVATRVVLVVAALFAGITVMVGNTELQSGLTNRNLATLASASNRLPMWDDAPNALSDFLAVEGQSNPRYYQLAVHWDQVAVARDPVDATAWRRLGFDEAALGDFAAGQSALQRSVTLDPTIQLTYLNLVETALARKDPQGALHWAQRAQELFRTAQFSSLVTCLHLHDAGTPTQVVNACLNHPASSSHP
jgi:O-antigen ligase